MDQKHRAIRTQLANMAPKRAVAYIQSLELPDDEAACLIECDVRRRSYIEAGYRLHLSPEAIKRRRNRAFRKIADAQDHNL